MSIWKDRLHVLCVAEKDSGKHAVSACLLAGSKDVDSLPSFVDVLLRAGYSVYRITEEVFHVATAGTTDFWMVYREGGRAPVFKHTTENSAVAEAKRVSRASGDVTHVLAVIAKIDPRAMPTNEEFALHAQAHPFQPFPPHGKKWGLWRVCEDGCLPYIKAVSDHPNGEPYASADSPGGTSLPKMARWFPLDANGKDITDDEIPF